MNICLAKDRSVLRLMLFYLRRMFVYLCPQVKHKSTQRQVNITVKKQEHVWWDRLVKQEKKPLFLAPDFDRWLDESDAEMELREKVVRND